MSTPVERLIERNLYLRQECLKENGNYYLDQCGRKGTGPRQYKIMLHYPNNGAIRFMMESWAMVLDHMGVEVILFPLGQDLLTALDYHEPNIFITCADPYWFSTYDPQMLVDRGILIGHISGGSDPDYPIYEPCHFIIDLFLKGPKEHQGKPVHRIKFGSNPLVHYANSLGFRWTWFYVGVGSDTKKIRARDYLYPVIQSVQNGLLIGNGWDVQSNMRYDSTGAELPLDRAADFYSHSIVSLNFHQQDQIDKYVDVNERTFIIPACCGFQVCDNPVAMADMYAPDEVVYTSDPDEYLQAVRYFILRPEERLPYMEKALERTYREHTYFHSMRKLIGFLGMVIDSI
jgi:hypothetical protein